MSLTGLQPNSSNYSPYYRYAPPPVRPIVMPLPAPITSSFSIAPPPAATTAALLASPQIATGFTLDQFQRRQTQPIIQLTNKDKAALVAFHPLEFRKFQQMGTLAAPHEGLYESLYMYDKVYDVLNPYNRAQLKKLLGQGVLQNTKAEGGHSALFQLYAMLTTRRAPGYDAKALVNETVDILCRPYAITQKFAPLSEDAVQKILLARNYPESNRAGVQPPSKLLTRTDLNVEESGTCVASSVMYYMADREPAELARHLNELTSPLNAFFKKVKLDAIAPDNPNQALLTLQENKIPYQLTGPNEATITVNLPPAGALRAKDSQRASMDHRYRNAIETAYQSALTFLVCNAYDPAIDKEDSGPDEESRKGLTEQQKSLLESIVKGNGGVQSVTYQAVDNKANPAPGEENNSYLFGYTRPFEQTTNDILQSLKMKEPVIVGTTDTDETGAIVTGHEITLTGAYNDPADRQLKFVVADSDDTKPKLVVKSAKELIPTIHHAGLPLHLAQRINQEINQTQGILVPDAQDAAHFTLLHRQEGPMASAVPEAMPVFSAPVRPYGVSNALPAITPWPGSTPNAFPGSYNQLPLRTGTLNAPVNPFVNGYNNPFASRPIAASA